MRLVSRVLSMINTATGSFASVLMGIMIVNVAVGVFTRYILQDSLPWSEELGRYLMVWCGFLGCGLAMKDDGHVGVTMVLDLLPPGARRIVLLLGRTIITVFLAVVFVKSLSLLNTLKIQKSSAMEIPMAIPYASVTVGMALMFIENIRKMAHLVREPARENK
jgi:TRAP-type C4-dicarboxylate transport system permease small subunit